MDDATQKLGTCRTCRHAEHEGYICLNMASDSDCGCDKRPPKVVADATQKLVDEVMRRTPMRITDEGIVMQASEIEAMIADALEAAQRPPVAEPDNHHNADACPFCTRNRDEREAAIRTEAIAQRPPVSPEAREGMRDALREAHQYDHDFDPEWDYTEDDDRYIDAILARFSVPARPEVSPEAREEMIDALCAVTWPDGDPLFKIARVHMGMAADALLARFSVPSQPVYDEEAVARVIREQFEQSHYRFDSREQAAALVAALRGGELTREETNG